MIKIFCDKCGKELAQGRTDATYNSERSSNRVEINRILGNCDSRIYVICDACMENLLRFLENNNDIHD